MEKTIGELLDHPQDLQQWLHEITALQAMLHAVASTRLLDQWDAQSVQLEELAARAGMDESKLGRVIRLLASQGVLDIAADGSIHHTPRSRALQTLRASTLVQGMALQAGMQLGAALRTGKTAFEVRYGKPVFEYLAEHPEQADHFAQRMSQITVQDEPLILGQLALDPFRLAVDIGGSHGTLLLGLLARYPDARGIVFDLPEVAAQAAERLRLHPQGHRIETAGGDFLRSVPAGGDLYLLKQVLHNWDDAQCIAILDSVRKAMAPTGRLIVIDRLLPERIAPDMAFDFDVLMMIWSPGRERSLAQFREFLGSAGFAAEKVTVNPGRMSVIEAIPV
ncbi:MAG: hypothetical protein RLZZ200_1066 [Pseudomonadota bacterium]|jgi:hypothetical protein